MVLGKDEYRVVVKSEESIVVNKKEKEEELAKLQANLDNLEITELEKETWANEEFDKRANILQERIKEVQEVLDKING